eukprot:TRINITY_DN25500_c0_g1_i1.p2 TRINITY_DN25500_c0_g1~~TRINITY_DN25500_c0_g1_i1.p2  ORF type:complete len:395 (-),score=102.94 TRINITY_DN25500_c0_g1_i1:1270-2454(-)
MLKHILIILILANVVLCEKGLVELLKLTQQAKSDTKNKVGAVDRIFMKEDLRPKTAQSGEVTGKQCTSGPCCSNGLVSASGVSCQQTNPCLGPAVCDGYSESCPAAAKLPDGTACNAGKCRKGVCMLLSKSEKKREEKIAKAEKKASKTKDSTPVYETQSSIPPTSTNVPAASKAERKALAPGATLPPPPGTAPVCTAGGCCDSWGMIKPKGVTCETSKHPCYMAAAVCDGLNPKCPKAYKPDGTVCNTNGKCKKGECVMNKVAPVPSSASKPTPTSVSPIAQPSPVKSSSSDDAMRALKLKAEVASLRRQQEIHKLQSELIQQRTMLRNLKQAKSVVRTMKNEVEMNDRALYPFKVDHAEDADNTFDVHDYIKQMTERKRRDQLTDLQNKLGQ